MFTYMETKAQAAYNNAKKTYEQAIETRTFFDQLLDGVPVDDTELYAQIQAWREEAETCINAAWKTKMAASSAMAAVLGK